MIERLADTTLDEIASIESDFTSGLQQDMSNDERERIQGWIAALRLAGQLFEPVSSDSICGFPVRATLRKATAKPMTFHLLTLPDSPANLVYIQEREVQVADIQTLWSRRRGDQPWRLWSEITGPPPRNQVVGLQLAEAAELASELGCAIPTQAEWRRAVGQIPDAQAMDFVGGVWELCSDTTEPGAVTIVGGCWHDHDTKALSTSLVPILWPETFSTSSTRPRSQK